MARVEHAPTPTERQRLTVSERRYLMEDLTAIAQKRQLESYFTARDFSPYIELLAAMTLLLADQQLSTMQRAHLRKIGGLQARNTPVEIKYPGDRRFWEAVRTEIGPEWEKAETFPEDKVPRTWQTAQNDLIALRQSLGRES